MKTLISAAMASTLAAGIAPRSIVYLPEGSHQITATVNGKPGTVTVTVPPERGHEIAAKLQASLARRLADNVRPVTGFDHKPGVASAIPQALRYEPGRGIVLDVDWTSSGRAAVEGRDYSYFSPTFYRGDDGTPEELPEKGEIGSLVNNPAFRSMQRISAADATLELLECGDPTQILEGLGRSLVAAGAAETLDDGIVIAVRRHPEIYSSVMCGEAIRPETKRAIEEMKQKLKSSVRPKDKLAAIAEQILEAGQAKDLGDAFYMACVRNPELYQDSQDYFQENVESMMKEARENSYRKPEEKQVASKMEQRGLFFMSAGQAETMDHALSMVMAAEPSLYSEYLQTLS